MGSGLNGMVKRLKALLQKRRMERDMADEMAFHQAALRERYLREGMGAQEADAAVRRRFGSTSRWQERLRELWQFRWLENLGRDLRFAVRLLWKSPGFTAVALLTLALGVGANTAVFSIINGLLLRPLHVPENERLAVLSYASKDAQPSYGFCAPYLRGLEKHKGAFENVFGYNPDAMQVKGASGNETVRGMEVSGEFFEGLKVAPLVGRYLLPSDDHPGSTVVVISDSFWESWFQRAPDIAGRKLVIGNVPFTVVGVMPKDFFGPDPTQRPEIYAPIEASAVIDAPRDLVAYGIHAWWLTIMGRLKPGYTLEQANAALQSVSNEILVQSTTDAEYVANEQKNHLHFNAESGSNGFTYMRKLFRKPLKVMFGMCGGILLLACMNLASLLMARAAARERELATRLALGATRRRLVSQLLIESLVIGVAGTALGLALAPLVTRSIALLLIGGNLAQTNRIDTTVDLRVFAFAAALSVVASIVIGLVPALQATGSELNEQIKQGQHAQKSQARHRLVPRLLMGAQVALALVLVTGAGLLATSLVKLYRSGPGFDPQGIVNISFSMDKQSLEGDALMQVYRQLGEGLARQPGVKGVAFQFILPISGRGWNGRYSSEARSNEIIWMNSVGPDYFRMMRIPMSAGREFTWNDTNASGLKMILNQAAAKMYFPNINPMGQRIFNPREKLYYEVVALVGDTKYRDMRQVPPPQAYIPIQQDEQKKPSFSAVVRTDGPLAPLAGAARNLAAQYAPEIPPPAILPMSDVLDSSLGAERMMAVLAIFFAGCALLVTAIGLYGTLAYATERRTSEIGIRMALGAQRLGVLWMIFRQNAVVAVTGAAIGLASAVLASKVLSSFLYETSVRDPWVLLGSVTALAGAAGAASLLPAFRASRIDPIAAIRCE